MFGVETIGGILVYRNALHILNIAFILALVWLSLKSSSRSKDGPGRNEVTLRDDPVKTRKIVTQTILLRRLLVAHGHLVGVAAVLMTFPAVRVIGQGVLASAGLISIVAGLAAQTTLSNVIAGIQLTLTDSIRVGDIVEVEQESGIVGEITLTYVVIYLWDDRRLILPLRTGSSRSVRKLDPLGRPDHRRGVDGRGLDGADGRSPGRSCTGCWRIARCGTSGRSVMVVAMPAGQRDPPHFDQRRQHRRHVRGQRVGAGNGGDVPGGAGRARAAPTPQRRRARAAGWRLTAARAGPSCLRQRRLAAAACLAQHPSDPAVSAPPDALRWPRVPRCDRTGRRR